MAVCHDPSDRELSGLKWVGLRTDTHCEPMPAFDKLLCRRTRA